MEKSTTVTVPLVLPNTTGLGTSAQRPRGLVSDAQHTLRRAYCGKMCFMYYLILFSTLSHERLSGSPFNKKGRWFVQVVLRLSVQQTRSLDGRS